MATEAVLGRGRKLELPTLQLRDSKHDELPAFSARSSSMRSPRMTTEGSSLKEVSSVNVVRASRTLPKRNLRIIEQANSISVGAPGEFGAKAAKPGPLNKPLKRVFDVIGAALLGLVFSPLIIVIGILLHREGGPIIFRHRRVGRDGKAFDCLKFRSMVPDADRILLKLLEHQPELRAEWLRDHKLRDDPRITAVGRFLRRTSLDELPQLWNVFRGEMSLVGPRPVVREELLRYGRSACVYLSARPGVTGLWQVSGRNNTDYRRRVALDVYYVRRQNLILDLYIVFKTTRVVLGGSGAY